MITTISIFILLSAILFFLLRFQKVYNLAYQLSHPRINQYKLKRQPDTVSQSFEFVNRKGIKLASLDIKPMGKIKGTIIVCHNLGGSKEVAISFTDYLLKNKFRLIGFDYCNHGESGTNKSIKFSLTHDFDDFFKTVKERGVQGPIGVFGLSVGANVALHAVGKYSEIKAAVVDSGPLIKSKGYFLYALKENKIVNSLERIIFLFLFLYYGGFIKLSRRTLSNIKKSKDKPIFFIHGGNDHIIPKDNVEKAYQHTNPLKKYLWIIPKSRHLTNYLLAKEEYRLRISDFFTTNL